MSSSAPTDSSTADTVSRSPFQENEKVLAFHGPCLYDAKVQKVGHRAEDGWRFFVHYLGWKKHWDEWLRADSLLKVTEENLRKQRELNEKHKIEKNAKPGRTSIDKTQNPNSAMGRKRKHDNNKKEHAVVTSPQKVVNIHIPSSLKKQLVDDCECITQQGQLVRLPRSPNVHEILNKYSDYSVKKDAMIVDTTSEFVEGLRSYFDKALPVLLLYKQERQQYDEVINNSNCITPSQVYGPEHLLRLFVKLPEMLSSLRIQTETHSELKYRLVDFLRFLQNKQSELFVPSYHKSETFTSDSTEEEH